MLVDIATILAIIGTIAAWFTTYIICVGDNGIYKILYGNSLYKAITIVLVGCSMIATILTYLLILEVFF